MVNIGILHESPKPTWTSRQLIEAFTELGARVHYMRVSRLTGIVGDRDVKVLYANRLLDLDAVVVRNLGFAISTEQLLKRISILQQLEEESILVVNSSRSLLIARDKYTSIRLLRKAGIPVPETIVTEDINVAMRYMREWKVAVIKPLTGSLGLGSIKVDDPDLAYRIMRTLLSQNQPIYLQRYVEKPGRDIRVFTVGLKVIAAAYRIAPPGQWKTNVALGARTEPAKVNEELEDISIRVVKALGLEYAGIDIAESPRGYVVFEANAAPLWRGLMNATGINPAKAIARHVLGLIKR